MGGCGTLAVGNNAASSYKSVGEIEGIKVLQELPGTGKHQLPEEAHSGQAYIKLNKDGSFNTMRIYGPGHYLQCEIAYHHEAGLAPKRGKILHIHDYPVKGNMCNRKPRLLTMEEYKKYKKFFGGKLKMQDGNVNEFLDSITRQDTAVLFRGKRYCFNPISPTDENPNFVLDIYIWSGKHDEDEIPVVAISGTSVSDYIDQFLKLPMWDGMTFWEAEKEMTWVDW